MPLHEYKCPNCNGFIEYSQETEKMVCKSCDSTFSTLEYNNYFNTTAESQKLTSSKWSQAELLRLTTHKCKSCDAELTTDESTAVTYCPYCGKNIFIKTQFQNEHRPDFILPFKLTKKQAISALEKFYKGRRLTPTDFDQEIQLTDIVGMYAPYWLFDAEATSIHDYRCGNASERKDSRGRTKSSVVWHTRRRIGTSQFKGVPIDASSKMPPNYMDVLEPFLYEEAKDFNISYFAGFISDQWDLSDEEVVHRCEYLMRSTMISKFRPSKKKYTYVTSIACEMDMESSNHRSMIVPVWVLTTSYKGDPLTFMVNGQTGKVVGELPVSKSSKKKLERDLTMKKFLPIAVVLNVIYFAFKGILAYENAEPLRFDASMYGWAMTNVSVLIGVNSSTFDEVRRKEREMNTTSYYEHDALRYLVKSKLKSNKRVKGSTRVDVR